MRRIEGMHPTEMEGEVERFAGAEGAVMVCDRSGEEGVNLQHAVHAILYDLPFAPNRIEQRLGRLDRIGRTEDLVVWVLPGPEPGGAAPTPYEAWLDVLRDGFGLFQRSAAPLQFLVARLTPELVGTLYREGARALSERAGLVRSDVADEERRAAAQDLVDGSDLSREVGDLAADIADEEADAGALERAVGGWLGPALHFRARRERGGTTYHPTPNTLLPADALLNRFLPLAVRPTTFDRASSLRLGGPELARAGHPLVDQVAAGLGWDDRGRAAAWVRPLPSAPAEFSWWGFRFDWTLESDLSAAWGVLSAYGEVGDAERAALRRRGDSLFPPHSVTSIIDAAGESITDGPIWEAAVAPYTKGRDRNLHKDRLVLLDTYVPPQRWRETVAGAGEASAAAVRRSEEVRRSSARAEERAVRERAQRLPILQARAARDGQRDAVHLEDALLEALHSGVTEPALVLEAAVFIAIEAACDHEE